MKIMLCTLALLSLSPPMARAQPAGWMQMGRADYPRPDLGRSGPVPVYYSSGSYVVIPAPGPHSFRYANGVRVWYGTAPMLAPVLTTGAVVPQGPAVRAPMSPGPRVYRTVSGVRVWYGQ
jgi:hypothetical protein